MGCLFPRLFTPPDETFRLLLLQRPYVLILAWSLIGLVSDQLGLWPASPLTPRQNGGFLRIDEMKTLCTCL